jgi:transcriptional regulator with XRE-family HTH domain
MNRDKFEVFLKEIITAKGLSKIQLAQKSGISRATLYNVLQGNVAEARLSTLVKLAAALDVHPLELLTPYFSDSISDRKLLATTKSLDTGFVNDVTYPDNSLVQPNQVFIKTWSVLNMGKTPWKNIFLTCQDQADQYQHPNIENQMQLHPTSQQITISETQPGERVEISVEFTAPSTPCRVISFWKAADQQGNLIFPDKSPLTCLVKVIAI